MTAWDDDVQRVADAIRERLYELELQDAQWRDMARAALEEMGHAPDVSWEPLSVREARRVIREWESRVPERLG